MAGIPHGKKVQIALRLDPEIFVAVERRAEARGISVAEQLRQMVGWCVNAARAAEKAKAARANPEKG